MRPKTQILSGVAADPDGFVASVTPAAGGVQSFTLLAAAASIDPLRQVSVTSAGVDTARVFTITGTDQAGNVISETITGVNATNIEGVKLYASITSITVDDDTAGAITIGWIAEYYTPWYVLSNFDASLLSIQVDITGAHTYDLEKTLVNLFDETEPDLGSGFITTDGTMAGETTDSYHSLEEPLFAVRIKAAWTAGVLNVRYLQQGI